MGYFRTGKKKIFATTGLESDMPNFKERIFSRRPCPYCSVTLLNARGLHAHVYRLHPEKL
jgi:hypothetical protein